MDETALLIMLVWLAVISINLIYIGYRVIHLEIMIGLGLFKNEESLKCPGGDE